MKGKKKKLRRTMSELDNKIGIPTFLADEA